MGTSPDSSNHSSAQATGLASYQEVLSFGNGFQTKSLMIGGIIAAICAGAMGPLLIWYFAQSFSDLSADPTTDEYLENVTEIAYAFLVLGALAFCFLSLYSTLLQTAAGQMTMDLKTKWYRALLRQDLAYFDIQDVSGTAMTISTNAAKFQRGVGNKLGLFSQFMATFLGGMIYAFYSSWQTSLVVLLTVPFMAISGWFLVKMTSTQSQRKNASYAEAGAIVYTTVTSIRTILSLNGAQTMIDKFQAGTTKAYHEAVSQVHWLGVANGSIMSSFLLASVVVPLFGGYLLYDQVQKEGCDPSGGVPGVPTCDPSGEDIFGAMFGIFFSASVLPQITTTLEAITEARSACFLALQVMNRKAESASSDDAASAEEDSTKSNPVRRQVGQATALTLANLPKYEIDSLSLEGKQLENVEGAIEFQKVSFSYPTRMETKVFQDFSLKIQAGSTVALVGASGSGKSTIAQLFERFYDPSGGSVTLDGHDLKDLNLAWLRQNIGLVSQEPALFATSIRENIAYGLPGGATMEHIEEAAKVANAHDFITDFPDGYETQVGDKGAKLSGGQKQRIAIARTIIKNPKILVLDEATSALDTESERLVQTAIDKLLESSNRTTIVIAHRLSTVRHADVIAVLENGQIVEMGSHDELIQKKGKYDLLIQAQKHPEKTSESGLNSKPPSAWSSRTSSSVPFDESNDRGSEDEQETPVLRFRDVKFAYPTRPDSTILSDFNLSVHSGETLAIVGPSGHGKSTVIQLIERFYDPGEGCIELDGVDLRSCNPNWLRDQVGLVSQEPTLFDQTIAENIRFGLPDVTQEQIEQAAKEANAHDFIVNFPDGYNTQVGEGGTQVSGGQKQRICIARVLLRKPRLLLLDEATSALDTESERSVQEALDKIMVLDHQSTIVIAHRLSTIQNADRIAVIAEGKIKEIGTYDELMSKEHGHFRRLQAFQNFDGFVPSDEPKEEETNLHLKEKIEELIKENRAKKEKQHVEEEELKAIDKESEKRNANRARQLAKGDEKLFLIGSFGAILTGAVFPAWGFLFAYMIELMFTAVLPCESVGAVTPAECQEYHDSIANDMNELAKKIAYAAVGTIFACMLGYVILFYGFGTATERMNKRVRDQTFSSLIRQEVGYFDAKPAGKLTTQLQDDAAMIHSFSGEPIRTLMINVSSVAVGLVIGFVYMWEFALLFLGILPFLGFGAEMEMKMYVTGEDEGDDGELLEDEHSPGGIVIESLLNIRTVASLTLEETKLLEFRKSLEAENPRPILNNFLKGSGFGLGQFFQFWGIALMIWFGAWLLNKYPEEYDFRDFIISMFGLFFSLYGLTVALEGATDRNKAKLAADRIFGLIDRPSAIDPLGEQGTTADKKVETGDDTSEEEVK